MIEFIPLNERATRGSIFSGSRGEVANRLRQQGRRRGGFKGLMQRAFAGPIAKLLATGIAKSENAKIEQARKNLETAGVKTLYAMNTLETELMAEHVNRDHVVKSAKTLRDHSSNVSLASRQLQRLVDAYQRLNRDEMKAGAVRFQNKEMDRYELRDIYNFLAIVEDESNRLNRAATMVVTGDYDTALRLIRQVKTSELMTL